MTFLSDEEKISWSRSPSLRFSDGAYLRANAEGVSRHYPKIEREGIIHVAGQKEEANIIGADRATLEDDMTDILIDKGSWLSDDDYVNGNLVCVISWELEERLVQWIGVSGGARAELVGSDCLFQNARFRIAGVFKPEDPDYSPWHLRRSIYLPLRTMQKHITGLDPDPGSIRVSVADPRTVTARALGER